MEGYIKLYRKSLRSRVFKNAELWKVWTWCLMKANHEKTWVPIYTGRGETEVELNPGQFIFGRKTAARELGIPESSIRNRMKKLKNMQNLDMQQDTHYSIVSIMNWDIYQGIIEKEDNQKDNHRTGKGQAKDTDKNDKNDKNKTKDQFKAPEWLDSQLWIDFRDHRKKLKKPMTDRAEKLVIQKCEFLKEKGYNPNHLIMSAIESGWQTVYEPKGG